MCASAWRQRTLRKQDSTESPNPGAVTAVEVKLQSLAQEQLLYAPAGSSRTGFSMQGAAPARAAGEGLRTGTAAFCLWTCMAVKE